MRKDKRVLKDKYEQSAMIYMYEKAINIILYTYENIIKLIKIPYLLV